jgi:hypothetical protein
MRYITIIIAIFLIGCRSNIPSPTFTIKGRLLNGTTGKPFVNMNIHGTVFNKFPGGSHNAGSTTTDSSGRFTIKYSQFSTNNSPKMSLITDSFGKYIDSIPLNRNIDSTFFISTLGTLKIILNKLSNIGQGDTLFISIPIWTVAGGFEPITIDTLVNPQNGFYKNVRMATFSSQIFSAVGSKNFGYYKALQGFGLSAQKTSFKVSGDPFIDNVTINF